ncbi:hypothetical protein HS088_TW21G01563 [Tripterygium wilfordii]|uniref:Pentatricopeptide repeat-containing protein n=1 Tax=Tripterygium wilfordii TaxID=458696 RepID=A0A7J7C5K0_TRIWF|nr:hypothetical protein HS088_TW21G01563 [Tripterygium wilfordii]
MDSDIFVGTALLDLYAKCGLVNCATQIFDCMPERNAVTWSSMVAGYVQNELYEEALLLFHKGQMIGLEYSQFTISSVISACAGLAAMIQGTQVHGVVCKTGFGSNNFVASSLIEMYARCGCVRDSSPHCKNYEITPRTPSASRVVNHLMNLMMHLISSYIGEVAIIPLKRLCNKIAGFSTHLMKRIQKGPVRGISLKLQEAERERCMDFVPDVSAIKTDEIKFDKETLDMLAAIGMSDVPGLVEVEPQAMVAPTAIGRGAASGRRF